MKILLMSILTLAIIPCLIMISQTASADEDIDQALLDTQEQLRKADLRIQSAKQSAEAAKVTSGVSELAGNKENEQEIYELASEVLGNFKGMNIEQMKEALLKAQNNPEKFASKWTPEQKKRLSEISKKLPQPKSNRP